MRSAELTKILQVREETSRASGNKISVHHIDSQHSYIIAINTSVKKTRVFQKNPS